MVEQAEPASPKAEKLVRKNKRKVVEPSKKVTLRGQIHYSEDWVEFGASSKKTRANEKRPVVEVEYSPPSSPSRVGKLVYGPESTLLDDLAGPLALNLMQHSISDSDLKSIKMETEQELDEQITLGFFRVRSCVSFIVSLFS